MLKIDPTLNELENFMELVNSAARATQYAYDDLIFGDPLPYTATDEDQHNPNTIIKIIGKGRFVGETYLRYRRLDLLQTTTTPAENTFVFNDQEETVTQFLARLSQTLGLCRLGSQNWPGVDVELTPGQESGVVNLTFTPSRAENNYLFTGTRTIEVLVTSGELKATDFIGT